jgi:[CysO sulfur-carrier protein]-S-L-cysteine hydrolase
MNDRPASSPTYWGQSSLRDVVTEDTQVSSLILSTELRDTIVQDLRWCLPHEGVGVLATCGLGSALTAVRFYPGRNTDRSPRRFTMEPADVLTALADMKREKTRFGAIVHSHPNTAPIPSRTDLVEAKLPGVLSLIVGFSPVVELRAWRLVCDGHGVAVRFDEVYVGCRDTGEVARLGYLQRASHDRGMPRHSAKGSA